MFAENSKAAFARYLGAVSVMAGALLPSASHAQFAMAPNPVCPEPKASQNDVEQEFRIDVARHVYSCYPMKVYRGKMPPMLYGIMIVEVEIDAKGNVQHIDVVRKPAADEVAPWVLSMIKRASPLPAPVLSGGTTMRFKETFFVDKSGQFQIFTLTEGQH
jgi:periplasmic protein TonB